MEEKEKIYNFSARINKSDLGKVFRSGLINLILAMKIKEPIIISKLKFKITISVRENSNSDIGIHRITIIHNTGYDTAIVDISGCLEKVFDEERFLKLGERERKRLRTWYCPVKRLGAIKSVEEILDFYKSRRF